MSTLKKAKKDKEIAFFKKKNKPKMKTLHHCMKNSIFPLGDEDWPANCNKRDNFKHVLCEPNLFSQSHCKFSHLI